MNRASTSVNWASYPILTYPDVPVLEIDLVGSPRDKPLGAGEAASAPVPAAIGNAVFRCDRHAFAPRAASRPRAWLAAFEGGPRRASGWAPGIGKRARPSRCLC